MKLYVDFISQPARAVWTLCKMANVQHELIALRIHKGDHKTEEFKKINPNFKVPAIQDGNFCLYESHAIMRYICEKNKVQDHFYPQDFQKRALVNQYLDWHHANTRQHCLNLLLKTRVPERAALLGDLKDLQQNVDKTLTFFENYWLQDKLYIGGLNELSIADLSAYCEIYQMSLMEYDFGKYPNLFIWLQKISLLKDIQETHQVINTMVQKIKQRQKL